MNFYLSVFLEKNFLENFHKKFGFEGNYPLIFTLFDQSYDSKNYFLKFRLYMPQICLDATNLKHLKFWKYFYWKHDKATLIATPERCQRLNGGISLNKSFKQAASAACVLC